MPVYIVTWDLNKEKPNYAAARAAFVKRLEAYDTIKDPVLDSVQFVSTIWNAEQISEDLRKYLDDNDRIIVVRMYAGSQNRYGWLNKDVWAWISDKT